MLQTLHIKSNCSPSKGAEVMISLVWCVDTYKEKLKDKEAALKVIKQYFIKCIKEQD